MGSVGRPYPFPLPLGWAQAPRLRGAAQPAIDPGDQAEPEPDGLADLRAAMILVAKGDAESIILCGFADGFELLRIGGQLAGDGALVEPLIRDGGEGIDLRVRLVPPRDL